MKYRVLALCLLLQAGFAWSSDDLQLATSEWPPFTGADSERHIAEDLVELALRKGGADFTVTVRPWNEALQGAKSGQYDGLVAAWHSAEREKTLRYSKPILENRILAVTLDARDLNIAAIADLQGKTVGKITGYTYGSELDAAATGKTVLLRDDRSAMAQLLNGAVDVVLVDDLSLRYLLREMPPEQQQRFRPHKTLAVLNLHFVVSRQRADAEAIVSSFNRAIDDMVADGSYNEVLDLPWLVVDTDQDGVHEYIPGSQGLDLSAPPGDNHYQVFQSESQLDLSPRRVYRVGDQQYDNWQDAREAIIDESQTQPGDRMIQDNRYQIGVPL